MSWKLEGRGGRHGSMLLMVIWGRVLEVVRVRCMNSPERIDAKAHPRFEMSGDMVERSTTSGKVGLKKECSPRVE